MIIVDNVELRAHLLAVEYVKQQASAGNIQAQPIAYANAYKIAYKPILNELKKGIWNSRSIQCSV